MTKVKLRVTATSHSRDWNKQHYEARVKVGKAALRNSQNYKIPKKLVIADLCKPTFYPWVRKSYVQRKEWGWDLKQSKEITYANGRICRIKVIELKDYTFKVKKIKLDYKYTYRIK